MTHTQLFYWCHKSILFQTNQLIYRELETTMDAIENDEGVEAAPPPSPALPVVLTDDEKRDLYQREGHTWSKSEQRITFGPHPWTWHMASGHTNRNYHAFQTTGPNAWMDTESGYLYNHNHINGEDRLHYRIPIYRRRHGPCTHPTVGDRVTLVPVASSATSIPWTFEVTANERTQTSKLANTPDRATGTLRYQRV